MENETQWRVSLWVRCLLPLVLALFIWVGIGSLREDDPIFGTGFLVLGPLGIWAFGYRPRICLSAEELKVVNPLRTRTIRLSKIDSVEPGYLGIRVRVQGGQECEAWAVQQTNLATWLGAQGRSARVVEEITAGIGRART